MYSYNPEVGMVAVVIFLLVVILCLAGRLFLMNRSIRNARRELMEISREVEENRVVKLSVPEKELEAFLEVINENLHAIRRERQDYRRKELALKEQVENISHDLRTPLTAILGYLKMIEREHMDADSREYLDIAIKKSYTLQNLISQFYELSRVTAEGFQLKLEPVDAFRILKEICLEHYGLFEKRNLEVQIPLVERQILILGDTEALKRVFTNLIQNSIRYAQKELKIQVIRDSERKTVKILFSNDINPEQEISDPERLFDRFYVQEQSRNNGGTGLGLTISKSLIEHMEGTIQAEYSGENGKRFLTFTMQFPYHAIS